MVKENCRYTDELKEYLERIGRNTTDHNIIKVEEFNTIDKFFWMIGLFLNNTPVLEYYGKKISWNDIFLMIDNYCYTFYKENIQIGDTVNILVNASTMNPHIIAIFLALNRMGVIVNIINPECENVEKKLNKFRNNKTIITDDSKTMEIVNSSSLTKNKVYIVQRKDFMPQPKKSLVETNRKITNYINGTQFILKNNYEPLNDTLNYHCHNSKKIEIVNNEFKTKLNKPIFSQFTAFKLDGEEYTNKDVISYFMNKNKSYVKNK